jgi:hypothetical protein
MSSQLHFGSLETEIANVDGVFIVVSGLVLSLLLARRLAFSSLGSGSITLRSITIRSITLRSITLRSISSRGSGSEGSVSLFSDGSVSLYSVSLGPVLAGTASGCSGLSLLLLTGSLSWGSGGSWGLLGQRLGLDDLDLTLHVGSLYLLQSLVQGFLVLEFHIGQS